jgi:hypothetical protein
VGFLTNSLFARFEKKYIPEPNSGCWLWTAALLDGRYGLIGRGGKNGGMALAHRVSWKLHNGKVPDGLWVLHKCDVTICVNPDHLFLGTHKDNMIDMTNKGRSTFGVRNARSKLTEELAKEVKYSSEKARKCARRLGVSESAVSLIRSGKNWGHI